MIYITITGCDFHFGAEEFSIGQVLSIMKENNKYDTESIIVMNEKGMALGHVANSVKTRAIGTHSAGYLSYYFEDKKIESAKVEVCFIFRNSIIAKVLE